MSIFKKIESRYLEKGYEPAGRVRWQDDMEGYHIINIMNVKEIKHCTIERWDTTLKDWRPFDAMKLVMMDGSAYVSVKQESDLLYDLEK